MSFWRRWRRVSLISIAPVALFNIVYCVVIGFLVLATSAGPSSTGHQSTPWWATPPAWMLVFPGMYSEPRRGLAIAAVLVGDFVLWTVILNAALSASVALAITFSHRRRSVPAS